MVKKDKEQEEKMEGKSFNANIVGERILADECDEARLLYDQGRYGEFLDKKFQYSLLEALYLSERGKLKICVEKMLIKESNISNSKEQIIANFIYSNECKLSKDKNILNIFFSKRNFIIFFSNN